MIVTKGIGSNRLITAGYGWKFSYAEAIPVVSTGGLGGGGFPWEHLGYRPYHDRPPTYMRGRRPRRGRQFADLDIQSEIVDVAAEAEVLPVFPAASETAAPGILSALGEPSAEAKTAVAPGPMQGLEQAGGATQERRGWSTGAKVALAVGAVGTAGLCIAAGYLIGRHLRAKAVGGEETEFCCGGGRERPTARGVYAPRKADRLQAKPQPRARKRRKGGG